MLHAVIMAGGSGTRFWPLSRRSLPKQFLTLSGERSLIQSAYDRCQPWIPADRFWVVTNARLADQTRSHLPKIPSQQILKEPCARNTAPCVGLAAMCLLTQDPDAVMLVMPADHVIQSHPLFHKDVELAVRLVEENPQRLALFGVPPTYPATGFGYIERQQILTPGAFQVSSFREKPDRATAEDYLRSGTFFWNCGIFVWKAARILEALKKHEPAIAAGLDALRPHWGKETWDEALAEIFPTMTSVSIDYAVLEREDDIAVIEATFDWDDVGNWEAMSRLVPADSHENSAVGKFVGIDTQRCIVHTSKDHLVATIGLEDCIVVHTADATLVAKRGDDEAIRRLIAALEQSETESSL